MVLKMICFFPWCFNGVPKKMIVIILKDRQLSFILKRRQDEWGNCPFPHKIEDDLHPLPLPWIPAFT